MMTTLRDLHDDFMQLQMSYNQDVAKGTSVTKTLFEMQNQALVESKIQLIKALDPAAVKTIEATMSDVKKIMSRSVTIDNSKELDKILFQMKIALKTYTDSLR
jgi:hypothetical protein